MFFPVLFMLLVAISLLFFVIRGVSNLSTLAGVNDDKQNSSSPGIIILFILGTIYLVGFYVAVFFGLV